VLYNNLGKLTGGNFGTLGNFGTPASIIIHRSYDAYFVAMKKDDFLSLSCTDVVFLYEID